MFASYSMNNNVSKQLDYDQRDQIPTFAKQFSIKILRLSLHMSYINRAWRISLELSSRDLVTRILCSRSTDEILPPFLIIIKSDPIVAQRREPSLHSALALNRSNFRYRNCLMSYLQNCYMNNEIFYGFFKLYKLYVQVYIKNLFE